MAGGTHAPDGATLIDGIPEPIVKLNRWVIVGSIIVGLVLRQPLLTTLLFVVLLPTALWGEQGSLIARLGRRLFARQIPQAEREDRQLMRFNNTIAVLLLGGAQVAFALGLPTLGWALALVVALAASVALAGFCVGCFLYFQFKLNRSRIFGQAGVARK